MHDEASARLRELITEGVLAPGSRLNERVLSNELRVSRTPLREAFKRLAGERLIELTPNRGARVAALSRSDVIHLFEVVGTLEGLAGELAASRRTEAEFNEIRARHFEMLAAHARRDLPSYYRHNNGIHRALVACTRNPVLIETYQSVNGRLQNLRFRSNFDHLRWDEAVQEHQTMIELLGERNGEALRTLMQHHLMHKLDTVLGQLVDPDGEGADSPIEDGGEPDSSGDAR